MGRALSLDSVCICQAVPQQSDNYLSATAKIVKVENFITWHSSVTRKCRTTARPPGNAPTERKAMQSHFMTSLQFQYQLVRKTQLQLPLCLLNPMVVNLSSLNLTCTVYKILTVKGKVLMTLNLPWLQLVKLKDIVHLEISMYKIISWLCPHMVGSTVQLSITQVRLQKINPLIEGFQRPTLGPVRNFSVVSDEFVQLLHTGQDHWVCVISRMSPWNSKTFL